MSKNYKVRAVPAYELPEELLEQKRGYDLGAFYHQAMAAPDLMYAYIIEMGDKEVACFWAHYSRLYKAIHVDTIVVDREFRQEEVVRNVMQIARQIYTGLASELGAEKITWASPPKLAERTMKYLEGSHVTDWAVAIDLKEESDGSDAVDDGSADHGDHDGGHDPVE